MQKTKNSSACGLATRPDGMRFRICTFMRPLRFGIEVEGEHLALRIEDEDKNQSRVDLSRSHVQRKWSQEGWDCLPGRHPPDCAHDVCDGVSGHLMRRAPAATPRTRLDGSHRGLVHY